MMQTTKFIFLTLILYASNQVIAKVDYASLQSRIFGGNTLRYNKYPYFAVVETSYSNVGGEYTMSCGGTLIAENIVMTAAQCIDHSTPRIQVIFNRFGSNDGDIKSFEAVDWEVHSDHTKEQKNVRNDIALIRLRDSPNINPVKLYFDGRPDEDDYVAVIGFGSTEYDESYNFLNEIYIRIISSKVCRGLFGDVLNTNLQFCTDESGKSACRGDSGGPAIVLGKDPSSDVQVGIISFGASECSTGSTVYSRVSGYENWIKERVCIGDNNPDWCNGIEMVGS